MHCGIVRCFITNIGNSRVIGLQFHSNLSSFKTPPCVVHLILKKFTWCLHPLLFDLRDNNNDDDDDWWWLYLNKFFLECNMIHADNLANREEDKNEAGSVYQFSWLTWVPKSLCHSLQSYCLDFMAKGWSSLVCPIFVLYSRCLGFPASP